MIHPPILYATGPRSPGGQVLIPLSYQGLRVGCDFTLVTIYHLLGAFQALASRLLGTQDSNPVYGIPMVSYDAMKSEETRQKEEKLYTMMTLEIKLIMIAIKIGMVVVQ